MEKNNSTKSNETNDVCKSMEFYSKILIGFIGTPLNLCSIVIYLNPKLKSTNKAKINRILLFKSSSDLITLFRLILVNLIKPDWSSNYDYALFAHIYTYYISFIAQLSSMLFDVTVSLDRYLIISNRCQFFLNLDYKWLVIGIYLYSSLFYIFKFFQFNFSMKVDANTTVPKNYKSPIVNTEFDKSAASRVLGIIHSIQRDIVCVALIIVLNVLLLIKIKKLLNIKRHLKSRSSSIPTNNLASSPTDSNDQRADSAEFNLTIMVILTGLTAIIGHTTTILAYITGEQLYFNDCFNFINYSLYFLSYTVTFFFYLAFNRLFREVFFDYCQAFNRLVRRVKILLHNRLLQI